MCRVIFQEVWQSREVEGTQSPIGINLGSLRYITQPHFSCEETDLLWNKDEIIWNPRRKYSFPDFKPGNSIVLYLAKHSDVSF